MPADEVSYETLKGRLYRERRSPALSKIEADFYANAERHLRDLQEEQRREQAANPTSPKAMVLHDELWNLQRVREDLYEIRERKLVAAALTAAKGGNPDRAAMTVPEADLYESLVRSLKDARRAMLKRAAQASAEGGAPVAASVAEALAGEAAVLVPPVSVTAPADPEPLAVAAAPAEAPLEVGRQRSGRVLVRPLEDLPAFTAPDLRTYRLRAGDLAAVPGEVARALVAGGKAVVYGA
ncbi:MAG TPA: hypothetical protein VI997_12405 [Candidatus Thermoplasmatota archaeon]|nr:hypothetical protein [Candidatus Thermoplasmatota archaeon]